MKPGILRNLKIDRVALVDRGANLDKKTGDGAHITLFKSAGPGLAAVHVDSTGAPDKQKKPKATIDTKEPDVKKSIISKILGALRESDVTKREAAITEIEDLTKAFPEEGDDKVHKADDPMCKCAGCMTKRAPVVDEAIAKRMSDIEKQNIDLSAKLEKAHIVLAAEIEKRENGEMVTVLKGLSRVGVNLDTDVAIFRKMKADNPAAYDRTIAMLKANDAQLSDAAMYKNTGSGMQGTVSGDSWAEIENLAKAHMSKSATKMTKEQAIEEVLLDPVNSRLVARYRENAQ